jgi:hypothetical protein
MKLEYAVLRFGNAWRVVRHGDRVGHFPDCGAAERTAGDLARQACAMGYDVDVLVQSPTGELRGAHVPHTLH